MEWAGLEPAIAPLGVLSRVPRIGRCGLCSVVINLPLLSARGFEPRSLALQASILRHWTKPRIYSRLLSNFLSSASYLSTCPLAFGKMTSWILLCSTMVSRVPVLEAGTKQRNFRFRNQPRAIQGRLIPFTLFRRMSIHCINSKWIDVPLIGFGYCRRKSFIDE